MPDKPIRIILCFFFLLALPASVFAQDTTETPVPEQVDVQPAAEDAEIQERLSGILTATGWFIETEVSVKDP